MTSRLIIVGLLLAAAALFLWMRGGSISGEEARQLVEGGAKLVDVRTSEEYAARHLPGAVNIALGELDQRMNELGPKDANVVVYCQSGARSRRAAGMLKQAGFTSVHDLGAMSRW